MVRFPLPSLHAPCRNSSKGMAAAVTLLAELEDEAAAQDAIDAEIASKRAAVQAAYVGIWFSNFLPWRASGTRCSTGL